MPSILSLLFPDPLPSPSLLGSRSYIPFPSRLQHAVTILSRRRGPFFSDSFLTRVAEKACLVGTFTFVACIATSGCCCLQISSEKEANPANKRPDNNHNFSDRNDKKQILKCGAQRMGPEVHRENAQMSLGIAQAQEERWKEEPKESRQRETQQRAKITEAEEKSAALGMV